MDDTNRRRRQTESQYPGPDARFGADQTQGQDPRFNHPNQSQTRGFSTSATDRFRPTPLTASPSAARPGGGASTAYPAYYQEPAPSFPAALPQNPLQYQAAGYPQDQRQQQGFTTYNQDLMYNVAQQAPQSNVYDSAAQFQSRQPASMNMLSDVAVPYFPNDPASAPNPPGLQHHSSSGSATVYPSHQQSSADRGSLLQQGYPNTMAMGGGLAPGPSEQEETFQEQGPAGMEAAYQTYQSALKGIFQNIIDDRLSEASTALLDVSEWLLNHVADLGLTVDETALHGDRLRLWGEFNTAWLSIFQKQKDLLEAGQQMRPRRSLISQSFIYKMAKDLIRMCDAIEKHGLVDYQYGVSEEQIINIVDEVLDIQKRIEGDDGMGSDPGRAPP